MHGPISIQEELYLSYYHSPQAVAFNLPYEVEYKWKTTYFQYFEIHNKKTTHFEQVYVVIEKQRKD